MIVLSALHSFVWATLALGSYSVTTEIHHNFWQIIYTKIISHFGECYIYALNLFLAFAHFILTAFLWASACVLAVHVSVCQCHRRISNRRYVEEFILEDIFKSNN